MEDIFDHLFGDEPAEPSSASAAAPELPSPLPFAEVRSMIGVNARSHGGRGVFACRDIAPGTLIVAEVPILQWAADSMNEASYLVDVINTIVGADELLAVTRDLHPVCYADAEEEDVVMATATLMSNGKLSLADIARNLESSEPVDEREVLRLFLVLQHNGFGSGLYRHLTKVNHSCLPNCIKFGCSSSIHNASEIWSTAPIRKGEELTICYVNPVEQSSKAMQTYLLQNHHFKCACARCSDASSTGTVGAALIDEESLQENLEMAERELQLMKLDDEGDVVAHCYQMLKRSRKLILVACGGAEGGVGVFIRARVLKVAVQCACQLLEAASRVRGRRPKDRVVLTAATSYLQYSLLLLEQQRSYLGDDHIDLARTYFDVNEAVRCLLDSFPGALAQLPGAPIWAASSATARAAAAAHRQQGVRIKNMYLASRHGDALRAALAGPGGVWWGGVGP